MHLHAAILYTFCISFFQLTYCQKSLRRTSFRSYRPLPFAVMAAVAIDDRICKWLGYGNVFQQRNSKAFSIIKISARWPWSLIFNKIQNSHESTVENRLWQTIHSNVFESLRFRDSLPTSISLNIANAKGVEKKLIDSGGALFITWGM